MVRVRVGVGVCDRLSSGRAAAARVEGGVGNLKTWSVRMATTSSPTRFDLGPTVWVIVVAVLLVLLAAMAIYSR